MARRGRRGCVGCLARLIALGAIAAALVYAAIRLVPMPLRGGDPAGLSAATGLPAGWSSVLILGSDSADGSAGRTDTMMILSYHERGGELKLTSIQRDTMVSIPGYGRHKINAAYRYGGAELAMRTVNEAFGTDIEFYLAMDFRSFPPLIDGLGGIELTVREEELSELNRLVLSMSPMFRGTGVSVDTLSKGGERVRVTGLQALAFSRMRKNDSDYRRTSRQRQVIDAILARARGTRNPIAMIRAAGGAVRGMDTNIPSARLLLIAAKAATGGAGMSQFRIPADGMYKEVSGSSWYIEPDLQKNRNALRTFIYGEGR